jgi:hypothetical protein
MSSGSDARRRRQDGSRAQIRQIVNRAHVAVSAESRKSAETHRRAVSISPAESSICPICGGFLPFREFHTHMRANHPEYVAAQTQKERDEKKAFMKRFGPAILIWLAAVLLIVWFYSRDTSVIIGLVASMWVITAWADGTPIARPRPTWHRWRLSAGSAACAVPRWTALRWSNTSGPAPRGSTLPESGPRIFIRRAGRNRRPDAVPLVPSVPVSPRNELSLIWPNRHLRRRLHLDGGDGRMAKVRRRTARATC